MLKQVKSDRLRVLVVWERLLSVDNYALAQKLAPTIPDPRAIHYWEPTQALGWEYGALLPFPESYKHGFAVDVFLIFPPGVIWPESGVPVPEAWLHKLGEDERKLDGEKLRNELQTRLSASGAPAAPVRGFSSFQAVCEP